MAKLYIRIAIGSHALGLYCHQCPLYGHCDFEGSYECLLELPVVIRRGDVASEVVAFAKEYNTDLVVTAESPSPRFDAICDQISHFVPVEVLAVEPFFEDDGYIDLKRFSRYWKVAERYLFASHKAL